jgi:2-hydroxychromene-2-carboxylate isomerase
MKFYYDIVCPYAYLASARIEALAARGGHTLEWKPILLGGVFRDIGRKELPMPPEKARLNLLDMQRYAKLHGVPLRLHPEHPKRTVSAMRLLHTVDGAERVRLTHTLYRFYFVENRDISDKQVLTEAAAEIGRPELAARIDEPEIKAALRRATDEAVAEGVFGVPSFVVDGRLYWGQDRMHFFLPEALTVGDGAEGPREVTFFYDFSSPYSYLGSTQIEAIAVRHGAKIHWRPFLLGALFKKIGTPTVPIDEATSAKRTWMLRDLADWAGYWQVPFRWPSRFPMRTVTALRMVLAVDEAARPELTHRIYQAYWVEDRDISDPAELSAIARDAGHDPELVTRAQTDTALKQALIEATDAAQAAGVCGAPSFRVGEELFWGQDRLPLVARALAGIG